MTEDTAQILASRQGKLLVKVAAGGYALVDQHEARFARTRLTRPAGQRGMSMHEIGRQLREQQ